jgi:FkbM family methyltransferase
MTVKKLIKTLISKTFPTLRNIDHTNLHCAVEEIYLQRLLAYYDVDCIFDVGANYGQYASMLREKINYKGLIISFEPIPDAAIRLRELSKDDPLWVIEECALSKENDEKKFHIMESNQFSSLSLPNHSEVDLFVDMNKVKSEVTVKSETLLSVFRRLETQFSFSRPFLKMDTQGFDVEVVNSGAEILQKFVGLQSELAVKKIYQNSIDFRDAITIYMKHGFSLSAFVPNNSGHFPRLVEIDCIMVRNNLLNINQINS